MDVEFDIQYRNLLVHHLEREEIEHELTIRDLPFTNTETRAALARRLKERIKSEKEKGSSDRDFNRLNKTVESEIEMIDASVREIKDFLSNRNKYDGIRECLKTRLVHYFARVKRAGENTDNDEELADIDALEACIRGAFNTYFSVFSPAGQQDLINQINQSVASLSVASRNGSEPNVSPVLSNNEDERASVCNRATNKQGKRNLKSIEPSEFPQQQVNSFVQYMVQSGAFSWMFGPTAMQAWASQNMPPCISEQNVSNSVKPRVDQTNIRKQNREQRVEKVLPGNEVVASDFEANNSTGSDSDQLPDRPRNYRRLNQRTRNSIKHRPVADWKLRYDGSDNGQSLMKFLKEAEFYADSENMSRRELFRSAFHLFTGPAKTWFMTGFENEDFTSWSELKEELKREFLSPDHDHTCEIRAISRKQGSREKFHDYFLELQKIFNSLTKPKSEREKFDIVFRNMRADYKGHVVASEIDNLADLKKFGRRLDATYWYKYQPAASESPSHRKPSQVNEVQTGAKSKIKPQNRKEQYYSRSFYRSRSRGSDEEKQSAVVHNNAFLRSTDQPKGLQALLETYQPPKAGYCFNCRLKGHSARECNAPKHRYCYRCGFHNVDTDSCPYCEKNSQ